MTYLLAIIFIGAGALVAARFIADKRLERLARQNAQNEVKAEIAVQAAEKAKQEAAVFANKSTIEQTIVDMKKGEF